MAVDDEKYRRRCPDLSASGQLYAQQAIASAAANVGRFLECVEVLVELSAQCHTYEEGLAALPGGDDGKCAILRALSRMRRTVIETTKEHILPERAVLMSGYLRDTCSWRRRPSRSGSHTAAWSSWLEHALTSTSGCTVSTWCRIQARSGAIGSRSLKKRELELRFGQEILKLLFQQAV